MIFSTAVNIRFDIKFEDGSIFTNVSSLEEVHQTITSANITGLSLDTTPYTLSPSLYELRLIRDNMLSDSDWAVSLDSPLNINDKVEWANYRQALRDITVTNIGFDSNGWFLFPNEPTKSTLVQTPSQLKINANNTIDLLAGEIREQVVSSGKYVEEEYSIAYSDAVEWTNGGRIAKDVPISVKVWADASKTNNTIAADNIISTHELWFNIIRDIRSIRLLAKSKIKDAQPDEINDIISQAKTEFNNILK